MGGAVQSRSTSSEEACVDKRIFLNETADDHDGGVAAVIHTEQQLVLSHTYTHAHILFCLVRKHYSLVQNNVPFNALAACRTTSEQKQYLLLLQLNPPPK